MKRFADIVVPMVACISLLGVIAGLVIEPFVKWIGKPAESQPAWFTAGCSVVVLVFLTLEWHENRENDRMDELAERIEKLIDPFKGRRESDGENWK